MNHVQGQVSFTLLTSNLFRLAAEMDSEEAIRELSVGRHQVFLFAITTAEVASKYNEECYGTPGGGKIWSTDAQIIEIHLSGYKRADPTHTLPPWPRQ